MDLEQGHHVAERPRVTVLIPTYNRAQWLGGAIESALAQSWGDFQIVVSDNASTDATADVVAGYDDPRIRYVKLDSNLDLNTHYNLCFERCTTEFLCTLPDDDRFEPDFLARTVEVLDANPRAGLVHGQAVVVDRDGQVIDPAHDMTGLPSDAVETGAEFIRRSMDGGYRIHATTALIRTQALRGVLLDHRDYPVTDFGQWMRVALSWDIAFLARPLATYRLHTGSYTSGAAEVTDGGYRQEVDRIVKFREVKLRLLEEHAGDIEALEDLRRRAHRAFRRDLVQHAALATGPHRRPRATLAALADCARRDPRTGVTPAAWRLLATSLIGRRGVTALKQLLGRPEPARS
jgi:glycosyltransferase involved in cell wall biosynthesis